MNRYIDAVPFRNYIDELDNEELELAYNSYGDDPVMHEAKVDVLDFVLAKLDEQTTADVQPVVHAHWKNIGSGHAECSNCGMTVSADYPASPCVHYCAKCGARMDGDEDDNG